jgi:RNA polymerase sigma-70 factor, ECF subfamily
LFASAGCYDSGVSDEGSSERAPDQDALVAVMVAYQAGHLEGFERLYAHLAVDVRRLFVSQGHDVATAQDLVQETFLELHRSRRTYTPPLPVRPWVFGIARNVARRHHRLRARRAQYEQPTTSTDLDAPQDAAQPLRGLEPADIHDALGRLTAGRRQAWVLHHVHGFSFDEIGRMLRIGPAAAKLRSSRAMRSLRALLGISRDNHE